MMRLLFSITGAFALACGLTAKALALSPITYVSGAGADAGGCTIPAAACRSFAYALTQTSAGGEIKALDAADYRPVTIDKSVSITGVAGAGVMRKTEGVAVTILAGANDVVNLSGLTIDGLGQPAWYGISHLTGAKVSIRNCIIRNYGVGISLNALNASIPTRFLIEDTMVTTSNEGVHIVGSPGAIRGALRRVTIISDFFGIWIVGNVQATVVDSVSETGNVGLRAGGSPLTGGELLVAHSTVTGRFGTGALVDAGYAGKSAGDNFINGTTTGLTIVGTR